MFYGFQCFRSHDDLLTGIPRACPHNDARDSPFAGVDHKSPEHARRAITRNDVTAFESAGRNLPFVTIAQSLRPVENQSRSLETHCRPYVLLIRKTGYVESCAMPAEPDVYGIVAWRKLLQPFHGYPSLSAARPSAAFPYDMHHLPVACADPEIPERSDDPLLGTERPPVKVFCECGHIWLFFGWAAVPRMRIGFRSIGKRLPQ